MDGTENQSSFSFVQGDHLCRGDSTVCSLTGTKGEGVDIKKKKWERRKSFETGSYNEILLFFL